MGLKKETTWDDIADVFSLGAHDIVTRKQAYNMQLQRIWERFRNVAKVDEFDYYAWENVIMAFVPTWDVLKTPVADRVCDLRSTLPGCINAILFQTHDTVKALKAIASYFYSKL